MSKTKTYLSIMIAAIMIIAAGYIFNLSAIKSFTKQCLDFAGQNLLSVSAAVCAFLFLGHKNYWFMMLGCAIAASLIIQFIIIGHGAGMIILASRTVTFLGIVYLMNFARLLINK